MKRRFFLSGVVALASALFIPKVEGRGRIPHCQDCIFFKEHNGSKQFRISWGECIHPSARQELWPDYHLGRIERVFRWKDAKEMRTKGPCGIRGKFFKMKVPGDAGI